MTVAVHPDNRNMKTFYICCRQYAGSTKCDAVVTEVVCRNCLVVTHREISYTTDSRRLDRDAFDIESMMSLSTAIVN